MPPLIESIQSIETTAVSFFGEENAQFICSHYLEVLTMAQNKINFTHAAIYLSATSALQISISLQRSQVASPYIHMVVMWPLGSDDTKTGNHSLANRGTLKKIIIIK